MTSKASTTGSSDRTAKSCDRPETGEGATLGAAGADELLPPVGLRSSYLERGGQRWLVLSFPRVEPKLPTNLTPTECAVVAALLRGDSNQNIAEERGTSTRTVANQIASVFRKLGVRSRAELVFKLTHADVNG